MRILKVAIKETDVNDTGILVTGEPLMKEVVKQFPAGTIPISTQEQHGTIAVWGMCPDIQADLEDYAFTMIGTGMRNDFDLHEVGEFLGTVQLRESNETRGFSGVVVLHVFWR